MATNMAKRIKGMGLAVMLVMLGHQTVFAQQLAYNDAVKCTAYFITTAQLLEASDNKKMAGQYEVAAEYFYEESGRLAGSQTGEEVEQAIVSSVETMTSVIKQDMDNYTKLESMFENSCIAKAEATMASAN